jgi:ACS family hexuronate transporter-like MFS transporter
MLCQFSKGSSAGAIGGMLFSSFAGYLLELTGSYVIPFIISGSAYLLALGMIQSSAPRMKPAAL